MSKTDAFENDLLALLFNGTTIAQLADNATSSPLASLYVSMHTADPGETGSQTTSEAAYTGYARIAVSRNSGGWTVSGASVSPTVDVVFPISIGGSGTVTHIGIGTASSGAGKLLYSGAITPNLVVLLGLTPTVESTSIITED